MPILNDDQRATLAARLAQPDCAGLSDQAACDILNTPTMIPNPAPQGQVPNPEPLDPFALLGMISSESRAKIKAAGILGDVAAAIRTRDTVSLANWIAFAKDDGDITPDEATALTDALTAAPADIPDPSWPEMVHGPSWANTWAPGVEFTLPILDESGAIILDNDGNPRTYSIINHIVPEMIKEARS